ncbi:MAG: hypothetical protein H0U15_13605 [Geodermatophilaceae bacterium]|nr:hypothetical protein [Geodermatophilaceae bacterium]
MSDVPDDESTGCAPEPDESERATADRPDQRADKRPDKRAAELDVGWGERPREPSRLSEDDERLLHERPPHWE